MTPRPTRGLIVEDDDDLRHLFRAALALSGFHVTEARTGLEALQQIDSDPPDVVILDLGLPLFSGEVVREEIGAHASTRHIPIVVVTGSLENLDGLDVACVLRKPVTPSQLVRSIQSCLETGAVHEMSDATVAATVRCDRTRLPRHGKEPAELSSPVSDDREEHARLQDRTAELQKEHDALTSPPRTPRAVAEHTAHRKHLRQHQADLSEHQQRKKG